MNLHLDKSSLHLRDVVLGILLAAVLTAVNVVLGLKSGHSTYLPYDPIGAVMLAQSLPDSWYAVAIAPFVHTSGLWVGLISATLQIFGEALWTPYLMIFWQSAVMLTLAAWVGRYYLGFRGVLLFTLATAFLPLLGHALINPARELLDGFAIGGFFWPATGDATGWQCWICEILKTDVLAGSFVAVSIAFLAIEPSKITIFRIVASGVAISLAILTKGHAAVIYLAGWGAAVLVVGLLLGEKGPRFARRTYWALFLAFVPLLGAWWWFGAADFSMAYLRDSFLHPLFGSDAYLKPDIGTFEYIGSIAPAMIGFGAQILIGLSLLALVAGRASVVAALSASAPFFVASAIMTFPILVSPFGKNFTMMVPLYVTFWVGLMMFTGALVSSWKPTVARSASIWIAIGLFAALALTGTFAALREIRQDDTYAEVRHDRDTLHALAEAIVDSGAKTVLTPLAHTGIPAIFIFESTKVAEDRGVPVPRLLNTNWNVAGGEEARLAARENLKSFEAIVVVPGGPEKFFFLGSYQSHVYSLTEELVEAADSPFILRNEFEVGPTTSPFVYFLAGPQKMKIRLYVRSDVAPK